MAGVVVVSVFPPSGEDIQKEAIQFKGMAEHAGARHVLTTWRYGWYTTYARWWKGAEWPHVEWLATDHMTNSCHTKFVPCNPSHADIAFIQYSSGSTGKPKGIMISHGVLFNQLEMTNSLLWDRKPFTIAGWCPQYHDYGANSAYG